MTEATIYQDIAKRTGGDIYIGVVGPVRTGKSTFIQRVLDCMVLPNIESEHDRTRTSDEMPQSASGRTITTTEPKFIPGEAVTVTVGGDTSLQVKLIDCVGYMVDGALGAEEDGAERMVMTPWSEEAMPFTQAAEIGTGKVIREHATIGILVTTDGTVAELPRESYKEAEARVAKELSELGKPFAIVLNSRTPEAAETQALAAELEQSYGVPVALVNCTALDSEDIEQILGLVLKEFPIRAMSFVLPDWFDTLPKEHALYRSVISDIRTYADGISRLGDIDRHRDCPAGAVLESIDAGDGTVSFRLPISRKIFYETLSEMCGIPIENDRELIQTVTELADVRRAYGRVEQALRDVEEKGYGIVMPAPDELTFEEPQLVKQAGGWGVKVTAKAESIHMIRAGLKTELSPVVGTEEQSEEVVKYLMDEFEEDPKRVWQSNMFGKSLYDLVSDGLSAKLEHIPDDSREKLAQTLERILNEGANGLICILL